MKALFQYELSADMPIAVFDSGLGGISTLKELVRRMPGEDFVYYGDFDNAPYGSKSADEVRRLSYDCVRALLEKKVKAIVIACNTATSAAAKELRADITFLPIIGAEPALKPAVKAHNGADVLVLATEMTLREDKFRNLCTEYEKDANIIPLACPGLVEFVERGELSGKELEAFLGKLIFDNLQSPPDAVVLGCTHYPFVAETISRLLGNDVPLYDGNSGIANECARRLDALGLLRDGNESGNIVFCGNGMNEARMNTIAMLMEKK